MRMKFIVMTGKLQAYEQSENYLWFNHIFSLCFQFKFLPCSGGTDARKLKLFIACLSALAHM